MAESTITALHQTVSGLREASQQQISMLETQTAKQLMNVKVEAEEQLATVKQEAKQQLTLSNSSCATNQKSQHSLQLRALQHQQDQRKVISSYGTL